MIDSSVSTWIGDNKYRPSKQPAITQERIAEMISKLQPGDILIERKNWYYSNLFLPGFWKHGLLYCGTLDDLHDFGLDTDPVVKKYIAEYGKPNAQGDVPRVLEAISEGVVATPMEEATEGDYVAAFRPRASEDQIKKAIRTAFSHFGKPYDFEFNFQTADKIVCTELLYRSFYDFLSFPLRKFLGRWIFSGDDLVGMFAAERAKGTNPENRKLDFIFFLDSDTKTGQSTFKGEADLIATLKR